MRHPTIGAAHYDAIVSLTQTGDQVAGTWHDATLDAGGEITGTVTGVAPDTVFRGTTTYDTETGTGTGRCRGRANVQGSVTRPTMAWTSEDVVLTGCSGPLTQVRWTLTGRP